MTDKTKHFRLRFTPETHRLIRIQAAEENKSLQKFIEEIVEEKVKEKVSKCYE